MDCVGPSLSIRCAMRPRLLGNYIPRPGETTIISCKHSNPSCDLLTHHLTISWISYLNININNYLLHVSNSDKGKNSLNPGIQGPVYVYDD